MQMGIPDKILVASIKADDYASYNQLFVRYYSRLCSFVFRIVKNESAAEDVVQEFFIRLWTNRRKLEITGNIPAYSYRSSKNAALNYLRSEAARKKSIENIPFQEWQSEDNQIEQIEFSAALHECIVQLPERSREVFKMSRFDGMKQQEIADLLGTSVKTPANSPWRMRINASSKDSPVASLR